MDEFEKLVEALEKTKKSRSGAKIYLSPEIFEWLMKLAKEFHRQEDLRKFINSLPQKAPAN